MFHLPALTFWLIFPWPFIWLTLGIIMFFVNRRNDKLEEQSGKEDS